MTQTHSRFGEVTPPLQAFNQQREWMRIAGNNDYRERADDGRLLVRATALHAPSKKVSFEDRPCPICGSFSCWGC